MKIIISVLSCIIVVLFGATYYLAWDVYYLKKDIHDFAVIQASVNKTVADKIHRLERRKPSTKVLIVPVPQQEQQEQQPSRYDDQDLTTSKAEK